MKIQTKPTLPVSTQQYQQISQPQPKQSKLDLYDKEYSQQEWTKQIYELQCNKDIVAVKIGNRMNNSIDRILDGLQNSFNIQYLYIGQIALQKQDIEKIAQFIQSNQNLVSLYLCACKIDDQLLDILLECLKVNKNINVIDLSYNRITDQGLFNVLKYCKQSQNVKAVVMNGNQISEQNYQQIIHEVQYRDDLVVDLYRTKIKNKQIMSQMVVESRKKIIFEYSNSQEEFLPDQLRNKNNAIYNQLCHIM